jgi:hypothetical protein
MVFQWYQVLIYKVNKTSKLFKNRCGHEPQKQAMHFENMCTPLEYSFPLLSSLDNECVFICGQHSP